MISTDDLHKQYPNCIYMSLQCLHCPKKNQNTLQLEHHNSYKYNWLKTIICTLCQDTWFVCHSCIINRRFRKRSQLVSHNKNYHLKEKNVINNKKVNKKKNLVDDSHTSSCKNSTFTDYSSDDVETDHINCNSVSDDANVYPMMNKNLDSLITYYNSLYKDNHTQEVSGSSTIVELSRTNFNFNGIENMNLFRYWLSRDKPLEYLAGRSVFQKYHGYDDIPKKQAELNIKMFTFVNSLTRAQQKNFADVMNLLKPEIDNASFPNSQTPKSNTLNLTPSGSDNCIMLPTSMKELRAMYSDGSNSMKNILPHVKVLTNGYGKDEHSYVSFRDCVNHFILFGGYGVTEVPPDNMSSTSNLITSQHSRKNIMYVLENMDECKPMMIIPFTLFSDDFDPTVSIVTANRKGIWIYTCCFKNTFSSNDEVSNTYILAMGNKGGNHQPIMKQIEAEINTYRKINTSEMFYHFFQKQNIYIAAFPLVRHGDQPERRGINFLKLGKESNHARWRHSCDIKEVGHFLPSCHKCRKKIEEFFRNIQRTENDTHLSLTCEVCTSWEFDEQNVLLHSEAPKNFPNDMIPSSGKLPPMVLNKQIIKTAIELTFQRLRKRHWTKSNAKAYLNYFCIKHSIIDLVINRSDNAYMLDFVTADESNKTSNVLEEKKFLEEDQKINPHLYENIPLSCIMDVSMDDINAYTDSPMHLLSGYVKATMHLMFVVLKATSKRNEFFEYLKKEQLIKRLEDMKVPWMPIIEYKTEGFTGFKCSNFVTLGKLLKAHAMILMKLQTKDTNQTQIRVAKHVHETNDNSDTPQNTSQTMIDLVIRMLISVYNSLSYLMFRKIDEHHVMVTLFSIKRSLNDIDNVDKFVRKSKEKPIWHIKYNLLCLLNCPEDMRRFGPVGDRWEGSMEGEKCIQNIKRNFHGFRNGYLKSLHENYNIDQTIHNIEKMSDSSNKCYKTKKNTVDVYTYRHVSAFISSMRLHKPLIIYQYTDKICGTVKHCFILKSIMLHPIQSIEYVETKNFCHVFSVQVNSQLHNPILYKYEDDLIHEALIAIPYTISNNNTKKLYTFLARNGMELTPDFSLKLPVM